ncbi:hypothetical protein HDV03_005414 [Kappamyces sp. JEL0829]|nr:hypothetical protein HDV03_005414 [Kappamyces sp. JEL0829]
MRDRTLDLQPTASEAAESPKKEKKKKAKKEDEALAKAGDMNQFFEELAATKENIASIKVLVDEIRSIHDRTLNNVTSEQQSAGSCVSSLMHQK